MIDPMKRTTLMLEECRLVELKRLAAERGQTMSAVIDAFLAEGIRRASVPEGGTAPAFDMRQPKVRAAAATEREWGS
jgi:hypothetical protein